MCLPVTPFKIEKEWTHSNGLKCAVVQAREYAHRCGYVRVSATHPMYDKSYAIPEVDVHGGLTFAAMEDCIEEDGRGYWFGFDCAHYDDALYEPTYTPKFSFQVNLLGTHYWTMVEVINETIKLADQLGAMNEHCV